MTRPRRAAIRILCVLMMLCIPALVAAQNGTAPPPADASLKGLPPDFPELIDDLAEIAEREQLSLADWGMISYLAPRYALVGPKGVPYTHKRFASAATASEAFITGVFVATHGGPAYADSMRKELETSPLKQKWLMQLVGDESACYAALQAGAMWRPALQFVPSLGGLRRVVQKCMASDDVLVRRAGLLWGYWIGDASYWSIASRWRKSEKDPVTRRLAEQVVYLHEREKKR